MHLLIVLQRTDKEFLPPPGRAATDGSQNLPAFLMWFALKIFV